MPLAGWLTPAHYNSAMTIAERIAEFLRERQGRGHCDDCIAEKLGLARRQESFAATSALGTTREFSREKAECSVCGKSKTTTRALGVRGAG